MFRYNIQIKDVMENLSFYMHLGDHSDKTSSLIKFVMENISFFFMDWGTSYLLFYRDVYSYNVQWSNVAYYFLLRHLDTTSSAIKGVMLPWCLPNMKWSSLTVYLSDMELCLLPWLSVWCGVMSVKVMLSWLSICCLPDIEWCSMKHCYRVCLHETEWYYPACVPDMKWWCPDVLPTMKWCYPRCLFEMEWCYPDGLLHMKKC